MMYITSIHIKIEGNVIKYTIVIDNDSNFYDNIHTFRKNSKLLLNGIQKIYFWHPTQIQNQCFSCSYCYYSLGALTVIRNPEELYRRIDAS
jgi:hypothetical protein